MKIGSLSISAMHKWLFIVCSIILLACIPARVYSIGGYVNDPAITVPANAYTTFSMVYNGKRYYLGVDTIQAKAGKDTIAVYDEPCYAAMWIAGPMWSPTGAILPNKDYTRTVKSVWLTERITDLARTKKYLSVGPDKRSYALLVMTDEKNATMWHTAKDFTVQSQYMHGFTYAYSDDGTETYRYLAYDPVYGFSRLYGDRPSTSQRISVWDRKTGDDVISIMTPPTYSFELNTTQDTLPLHITTLVKYYTDVDRFRSRFDQVDVYTHQPAVYDNQAGLIDHPYDMFGFYEWASNPRPSLPSTPAELADQEYNGHSLMPFYADSINHHGHPEDPAQWTIDYYWMDSTVLWVSDTKYKLDKVGNLWHDTLFSIGTSPFNVLRKPADGSAPAEDDYVPHNDWLRQHFYIKNSSGIYEHFVDSILVVRRTFHTTNTSNLDSHVSPADHVFPYIYDGKDKDGAAIGERNTQMFTVSAQYTVMNDTLYANGRTASSGIGDFLNIDIRREKAKLIDGLWYDSLLIDYVYDAGTTTPCTWLTVDLNPARKDQIRVVAGDYDPAINANRIAEIHYTYRYSDGEVSSSRVIWVTQRSKANEEAGSSVELYAFNHKGTLKNGLQDVHERVDNIYAIPEDNLSLPIHRDHWGYYRWFIYGGDYNDKDLENNATWEYARKAMNYKNDDFMPINHTTDPASRGQWDVIRDIHSGNDLFEPDKAHFVVGSVTSKPQVRYPFSTGDTKSGMIACDVSAYYDIATSSREGTPYAGKNLTSLTEPTLSYRQVFNVQPAKVSADKMKTSRTGGNWMEEHQVIVPAGTAFSLQQAYPVRKGDASIDDSNLSYVYYCNPTAANEGTDTGFDTDDYKSSRRYNRIGVSKTVGDVYSLELLTPAQLNALERSQSYDSLLLVNPNTETGRLIGDDGNAIPAYRSMTGFSTEQELRDTLVARLNRGEIGSAYLLTFEHYYKSRDDYRRFTHGNREWKNLFTLFGGGVWYYSLKWYDKGEGTGSSAITIAAYTGSSANLPTGIPANTLMTFYSSVSSILGSDRGYLTAVNKKIRDNSYPVYTDNNTPTASQAWLVYKVTKESGSTHAETPRWEKSTNGVDGWTEVARWGTGIDDYQMLPTGELRVPQNVFKNENETLYYRLRTEHFQLAKFVVVSRNAAKVGPSTSAILSEDSIHNHYDILYSLGNESFEAPRTTDVKAYNHHLPWSYTELSYHYPRSVISDDYRVFTTDLPAEGEYAYLNKFELNGHTTSAISGAEHGYMLCIHAAQKPTTIFNFTYPHLPCTDQQIYLTFYLANPLPSTGYNPQITAELQGKVGEGDWTPINRFKTGELIHEEGQWQQFVLEIPTSSIADVDSFRCVANLSGSTVDNAYVLIDGLRFIAKERPVNIFQNKASCLEKEGYGEVDIIARLDYQNATYPAGTHFAYQYQKKDGDTFVPLQTAAEGETVHPVKYANDLGSFQMQDVNNKSCGVITMPLPTYIPTEPGDTIVLPGGITTRLKTYVNESSDEHAYYVMYISEPVYAQVGDTFRVAMTTISGSSDKPDFADAGCAMERLIPIHNPIQLHVNGSDTEWPENSTREDTVVTANATYTVTAQIGDAFLPSGAVDGSGKCIFDVVRTMADDRGYGADEWFKKRFGCSRAQFRDIMTIFRADDDRNPMRLETNWNNVRPEMFQYSGRTKQQADSMYTILNRLIVDSAFVEIGKSSYDIYLGENNNAYVVFWPIPASGQYEDATTHDIKPISVCSTPRWFEIHSDETSTASLRLGYDNMFEGDYYILPVVRASSRDANSSLKVRIADITHEAHAGVVIGWDSTYVVDSNDPEWDPATKTFRYHQNRIVQDDIFDNYYKVPSSESTDEHRYVTFTPVNEAYIALLQATDCKCYDYDASRTTWDVSGEGATNVLIKQSDTGCNKWGVKYIEKGGTTHTAGIAEHALPGFQTPNNMELKAGYWYKFRTAFFDVSSLIYYDDGGDGECRGHSEFIVAVAPDTVRWTPSHPDQTNYWNDDNNWTPVMAKQPADGFKARVPMNSTNVIIPQTEEGQLPVVSEFVVNNQDLRDFGYQKNTCEKILFKPHAQMLGQEKLTYTKAFVDVPFTTGEWQTFSPALDSIYAGDMYIPFAKSYDKDDPSTGNSIDTVDFAPKPFPYDELVSPLNYNPREYPFAFYQGFYNASVHVPYYNTDTEDKELTNDTAKSKSTVDWIKTPSMRMHYAPGAPCIIQGFDATDEDGRPIVVRLPKSETTYYGYGRVAENSYSSGMTENLPTRPTEHNLAYDKYAATFNESTGISYPLKNLTAAEIFFFGNPTMALVDVYKLCVDNADKLKYEGSTYHFTAYQLMDGSNYTTKTINGPGQYFIAPQRAIGLVANSVRNDLTITLKPSHLVAITGDGLIVNSPDIVTPTPAPKRAARTKSVYEEPEKRWLYVTASNETDYGKKKAYLTLGEQAGASRGYLFGEDALSLSSGLNYYSDESYSTPLSLYTIADNQALMQDVRDTLVSVPLIFTTLPDYSYDEYTFLTFSMSGTWNKPLYLYDALNNDSVLIRNGLQVAIPTPNSDQIRYFINGAPKAKGEGTNGEGVTTGVEEVTANGEGLEANGAVIYDMLGRRVLTLNEFDLISNIQLPTGVYIIQRGTKTERMVIR